MLVFPSFVMSRPLDYFGALFSGFNAANSSTMLLIFWFWSSRKFYFAAIFVCLSPRVSMVVLWFMYW